MPALPVFPVQGARLPDSNPPLETMIRTGVGDGELLVVVVVVVVVVVREVVETISDEDSVVVNEYELSVEVELEELCFKSVDG